MDLKNSRKDSGVSPVVGVILMVAVTVILAAVIGNFVLNLGSSVNKKASASVQFEQDYDVSNGSYNVDVYVTQISNADYLNVTAPGGTITQADAAIDAEGTEIPNGSSAYASGDVVKVYDVDAGTTVQVLGSLSGRESVVARYDVDDTQR